MAVSVQFGTYTGDVNKIHKGKSLGTAKNAELKHPTTVEAPYFIVANGSVANTDTYAYCSNFGRFYYIQQIDELPGSRKGVQCVVDPLMSFAGQIDELDVNVSRYEGSTESDIYDGAVVKLAQCEEVIEKFNGGQFNKIAGGNTTSSYVLLVAN